MKLIDKSALVAEIERLKQKNNESENVYDFGTEHALKSILSFLDTLEVKEVDFEKEIEFEYNPIDGLSFEDFRKIAKHFFELGLRVNNEKEKRYES